MVLFMDGFDHYPNGSIAAKWDAAYRQDQEISTSIKKTGTGALRLCGDSAYVQKTLADNYTTLGVGFMVYKGFSGNPTPGLEILDESNINLKLVFQSNGMLGVYRNTTLLGSVAAILSVGEWAHFQVKVVVDDSVGSVIIKKNGGTILTLNNIDTKQGVNAYSNVVKFKNYAGSSDVYFDDVYIAEDILGICVVETKYPNGAGQSTQWTPSGGSNYQCVDEASMNSDTDYVYSSTPGNIDTYTFTDMVNDGVIKAIQVNAFAKIDDTGLRKIALVTRPSDTDYVGSDNALTTLFDHLFQIHETNPDDSEPWSIADVNGCQFGIKVTE